MKEKSLRRTQLSIPNNRQGNAVLAHLKQYLEGTEGRRGGISAEIIRLAYLGLTVDSTIVQKKQPSLQHKIPCTRVEQEPVHKTPVLKAEIQVAQSKENTENKVKPQPIIKPIIESEPDPDDALASMIDTLKGI